MEQNTEQAFETIQKALRQEVTREQLYAVAMSLHEAIESLIDDECDDMESESEDSGEMEDMPGMSDMGEMEDKMDGQMYLSEEERRMLEGVQKGLWGGHFSPDLKK